MGGGAWTPGRRSGLIWSRFLHNKATRSSHRGRPWYESDPPESPHLDATSHHPGRPGDARRPGGLRPRARRLACGRARADDPRAQGRNLHPAQRPVRDPPRGPHHAVRRRQHLVQGRLQGREAGPDRVRPPVRTPDVPGLGAPRHRILRPAREARRPDQRAHQQRPDELLRGPAHQRPGDRPLARIRPDGLPPAGLDPGQARQPARRRQERAQAAGRQRPLRPGPGADLRAALSARPPVPPLGHRIDGRPFRRQPRRRLDLLPDLLQPQQRQPLPGRRHQPGRGQEARREVLRPDAPRPRGRPARRPRCPSWPSPRPWS